MPIGFLVLRRRGVYFSLLTLAFSALTTRSRSAGRRSPAARAGSAASRAPTWFGLDLENPLGLLHPGGGLGLPWRCALCAFIARRSAPCWSRSARTSSARSSWATRPTATSRSRYVVSAVLTGCAGMLFAVPSSLRVRRPDVGVVLGRASRDGHHRRHAQPSSGPALGALFYILFREYLSIWTPNWLLWFGLLFMAFIVFSPTGLVGVWRRLTEPPRPKVVEAAAMAARSIEQGVAAARVPPPRRMRDGVVLAARDLAKSFGGIKAVSRRRFAVSRPLAARADRTQRRRQDDGVQSHHGHVRARPRNGRSPGQADRRVAAARDRRCGPRPLVPDHQSLSGAYRSPRTAARGPGARRLALRRSGRCAAQRARHRRDGASWSASSGCRASSMPRLDRFPTAASGCSTWALALGGAPARAAARRAARRTRRRRARARRRADQALVRGPAGPARRARHRSRVRARRPRDGDERRPRAARRHGCDARDSAAVREVYIGSGTAALAATPRGERRSRAAATADRSIASTRSTARATS